ncbi:hypothetical protein EJ110_NYTH19424 [Nymphaea thermarum]|nr:hypothetical protein EJ110_NYTH19424 [Nymphaea thermarum]
MAEERNPLPLPPLLPPLGNDSLGTVAVLPTAADIQSAVASTGRTEEEVAKGVEEEAEKTAKVRRKKGKAKIEEVRQYPDDPYNRYWYRSGAMDGVISVARDNMSFNQDFRDIPGKELVKAIRPASSIATNLTVPTSGILSVDATYYYIFYFSEVSQAAYQNKSRSFDFLVDGIKRNGGPIIPPYQSYKTDQDRIRYLTIGSVISLVNIADASIPSFLNAMEVFRVQRGLADGTNTYDGFSFPPNLSIFG